MFTHNVYFTLHDNSRAAIENMLAACHEFLSGHSGTEYFSVGARHADCQRDVNDLDFDVALTVVFADEASHTAYQSAPRHHTFIAQQKSNWKHVRVFDSIPASR